MGQADLELRDPSAGIEVCTTTAWLLGELLKRIVVVVEGVDVCTSHDTQMLTSIAVLQDSLLTYSHCCSSELGHLTF